MNEEQVFALEDSLLAATYQKFPVALVRGRGATVWDIRGKEYTDCVGGYGVALVGHCHPRVVRAVSTQVRKLITCHGSFYNEARAEFLKRLSSIAPSRLQGIFLSNSGAEAVECALKVAIKHTGRKEVVAMSGSFHGKTWGALSLTHGIKYRQSYQDLLIKTRFANFGDTPNARNLVTGETAAIFVEPVQGEGGINAAPPGFLAELRELADKTGCLLVFDEIQSGLGRTGRMWAAQHWAVEPDILCVAKGLAGGLPMGATLARKEVMAAFKPGDHSSSFGGNPLVCAAASGTLEALVGDGLVERAAKNGDFFLEGLQRLREKHRVIREVRGLGLMIGVELRIDVRSVLNRGLERGLLLLYCGRTVLRFLPPLVISRAQIRAVLSTLDQVFEDEERARAVQKV